MIRDNFNLDHFQAQQIVRMSEILAGMQPAYRHTRTGESHLAQECEGVAADVYSFAGLPEEWIVEWDNDGNAIALHPDVVAGYWRDAQFIELSQLACMPLDA
jgi:hypothetical protein